MAASLTEFLLARIADVEKDMIETLDYGAGWDGRPQLLLARCESDRRIVQGAAPNDDTRLLRAMAAEHDGHPDYREEWNL